MATAKTNTPEKETMTKAKAREVLNKFINSPSVKVSGLPIEDVVVTSSDFEEWTFKGLIKLAYDLK